jgi:hypothetical protein
MIVTGVPIMRLAGLLTLALIAAPAPADIFPDQAGDFIRSAPKALSVPDQALYAEYGLEATEQAEYTAPEDAKGPARRFSATAWRFHDSTGAMALFQLRRPPGAAPARLGDLAVRTSDGMILAYGNYVFQFTGSVPGEPELNPIYFSLPRLEQGPLPAVAGYLPPEGLIPNSERYILGPVSLERFEPRVSPSLAAFHLGSEGQLGRYKTPQGELTLLIFNYPTPSLARERAEQFQKLPGVMAKRTGPLVALVVQPPDLDAAERILARIRYQANLTLNTRPPQDFNLGLSNMILSIMALAGVLIGLSLIVGIGFGGFRILLRKLGWREDVGTLTVLRIDHRPPDV